MNSDQEFRLERLRAFIDERHGGNKTAAGRALGYKDGSFLRQFLARTRPITEKSVTEWNAKPGVEGWFRRDGGLTLSSVERDLVLAFRAQVKAGTIHEVVSTDLPPRFGNPIDTVKKKPKAAGEK